MNTLITTPKRICAFFFGPNDGEKAWFSNRRGLAGAAINSVAGSDLPSAEHYWRDVLPPGSLGANWVADRQSGQQSTGGVSTLGFPRR